MPDIWGWAKSHPYMSTGLVFVVGVGIYVIFFSGRSSGDGGASALAAYQQQATAAAESGNQLQAMQAQLQAAQSQVSAGVAANASDNSAAIQAAQIQADAAVQTATITADAQKYIAAQGASTAVTTSTLSARASAADANAATVQSMYDKLGTVTSNPLGTDYSGFFDSITGQFALNAAPHALDLVYTPQTAWTAPFITDPSGSIFQMTQVGDYGGDLYPTLSTLPTGSIYSGNGIAYVPTGRKASSGSSVPAPNIDLGNTLATPLT